MISTQAAKRGEVRRGAADNALVLDHLGRLMDSQFALPILGWRYGLNFFLDLIPGVGDATTSLIALVLLVSAVRRGVPRVTLLRMALNIGIYALGGVLPIVGDLFDTWWKPNMRNLELLRRFDVSPQAARQATASDWMVVGGVVLTILLLWFASVALLVSMAHFLIPTH